MRKILFPLVIALSALSVSGSAAFYSVFGLSKLFAGASTEVIIMAGSLEVAKLICAALIYTYWSTINKILRTYLMLAVFVLMVITSGGIYGFLSGAYQSSATKAELLDKHLSVFQVKQDRFIEQVTDEKEAVRFYTEALSNPTMIQYVDSASGQLVTTSSYSQRRLMKSQLQEAKNNMNRLNDSISHYDMIILNKRITNEEQRELGPLKYLAKTTNKPMDTVVNWFLLLIVFVFDPLAIAMVVAATFAFSQITKKSVIKYKYEPKETYKLKLSKRFSNWFSGNVWKYIRKQ